MVKSCLLCNGITLVVEPLVAGVLKLKPNMGFVSNGSLFSPKLWNYVFKSAACSGLTTGKTNLEKFQ